MSNKNLTLAIDAELLSSSRKYANNLGVSLNQLIRDYLTHLVGKKEYDQKHAVFFSVLDSVSGNSTLGDSTLGDIEVKNWSRSDAYE